MAFQPLWYTQQEILTLFAAPHHDYLKMNLDFSTPGEVQIDINPCILRINLAFPEKIMGVQSTLASNHLFQVGPPNEAHLLPEEQACIFHHTTTQLMFLSWVRQDIQTLLRSSQLGSNNRTRMTGAS